MALHFGAETFCCDADCVARALGALKVDWNYVLKLHLAIF